MKKLVYRLGAVISSEADSSTTGGSRHSFSTKYLGAGDDEELTKALEVVLNRCNSSGLVMLAGTFASFACLRREQEIEG